MKIPFIGSIIEGVTGIFKKKEERKLAVASGKLKIQAAKDDQENNLALTDAEWENIAVEQNAGTWKDEYLTIVVTAPLVTILAGAILTGFDPSYAPLLEGTKTALKEMKAIGVDLGYLMEMVVMAGIGLKLWRAK